MRSGFRFVKGAGWKGDFLWQRGSSASQVNLRNLTMMRRQGCLQRPQIGAPSDAYDALDHALNRMETSLDALKDPPTDADNILRRARQLRFDLNFIIKGGRQTIRLLDRAPRPRRVPARVAD